MLCGKGREDAPAPRSLGPLSKTTRAHSLCAEFPMKSSASLSLLLSKHQIMASVCDNSNSFCLAGCTVWTIVRIWQGEGCMRLYLPEDPIEGFAKVLMRLV